MKMSRLSKAQLHHILFDPSLVPRYNDLICAPHQLSPMIEVIGSVQRNWAVKPQWMEFIVGEPSDKKYDLNFQLSINGRFKFLS